MKQGPGAAERRLWASVVLAAFNDARSEGQNSSARRDRRDALAWFGTPDFGEVCEMAGLSGADCRSVAMSDVAGMLARSDGDNRKNDRARKRRRRQQAAEESEQ